MARFLLICLGGAVGTGARYLFSTAMKSAFGNFPFGTLGVNVIGSFLASVVMVLALEKSALSPDLRLIIVTGVLGGFTTYSSFNYETLHLAQSGAVTLAITNVAVTLVTCWLAGIAGIWITRQFT
ncbi:MAG TPA: fluoride efflux transporter CrcB [Polyangia bacterium]|nr:fluoride efflux transporter CrcB [Polyangia bacterium]